MRQQDQAKPGPCGSCGGFGYLENTADHIERCDACKKFTTDEDAFQAWVSEIFLPLLDDYKDARLEWKKRKTPDAQQKMLTVDRLCIERYRIYRKTNQFLNRTERAAWWTQRREQMEALEAEVRKLDSSEPVVISDKDAT